MICGVKIISLYKIIQYLFFIISPFFILLGIIFLIFSLIFRCLNFSIYIHWELFLFSSKIRFPIFLDFISSLFMGLVLIIRGSIIFYSEFYIESEIFKYRFFFLMIFFVFSIVFLILCPNFICILVGWDGLGLVSYCLVIYYQNFKSFRAGMITALTNRIGDVFILGCISLSFFMGRWRYINFLNLYDSFFLCIFFIIAAITKRAQIPFSAWLPAAIAAPTPVSSLVHSSTLVTAGVYILIRFNYYLDNYLFLKVFLFFLSLLTIIISGLGGLFEYDLKKIIALSTLSQLGFIMATISLGLYDLAFFHLCTHACFKALLFICAGIFIHRFIDNQDIRRFGFINKNFSLRLCIFNTASLSLSGFPFLSGFFSKDLILELILLRSLNFFFFFLFLLGTFLTVFYRFRLLFFLTFKQVYYFDSVGLNIKNLLIQKSLLVLFIFSVSLGSFISKLFFFPYNFIILPFFLKVIVSVICLLSFFICFLFTKKNFMYRIRKRFIYFLSLIWFLPFLKTDFLKKSTFKLRFFITKLSIGWVEISYGLKIINYFFQIALSFNIILTKFMFFIFLLFLFFLRYIILLCFY